MRSRFSRRNRLIGDALESQGVVAKNQTILGVGETPFYTDIGITIAGTPVGDGGGGGTIPGVYPPPGPDLPPPVPPPSAVSALQIQRPVPFWVSVNSPALSAEFVYRHTYDFSARLLQCYLTLRTSAVVGARAGRVSLRDGGHNRVAGLYANVSQAASSVSDWQYCHNWPLGTGTHGWDFGYGFFVGWLPNVSIMPQWTLQSEYGLLAGDQFSGIKLLMIKEPSY